MVFVLVSETLLTTIVFGEVTLVDVVLMIESQKQTGGVVDSSMHQPVGLNLAMQAASVMAGALGGPQVGSQSTLQVTASDPLTLYLAKLSRTQLSDIISSIKV